MREVPKELTLVKSQDILVSLYLGELTWDSKKS
jgi:hypothetical protein